MGSIINVGVGSNPIPFFCIKKVEHTQEIQYNKSARNKTAHPGPGRRQEKTLAYKQKARCRMLSAACFAWWRIPGSNR